MKNLDIFFSALAFTLGVFLLGVNAGWASTLSTPLTQAESIQYWATYATSLIIVAVALNQLAKK